MTDHIKEALERGRGELRTLCRNIHDNPETGLKEQKAAAWQVALLRSRGFAVEAPFGGLETAYKATSGTSGPTFCFCAEYDALKEVGHACGHNLIATGALAAGVAVKNHLDQTGISGSVVVMGTPAEEGLGGKVRMIRAGAFAGIDAAMLAHPLHATITDPGSLAVHVYTVRFKGLPAHAAVCPERGRNALDAVMLLFQGINAWRQQLPEACRVHGIITEGGTAPNIIPDHTACQFYLRADNDTTHAAMIERFKRIVRGAELMTDTTAELTEPETPYKANLVNAPLNQAYFEEAGKAGLHPKHPKRPGRMSTDFGDVSQAVPGAHVYFAVADQRLDLHTREFEQAAGSDLAFDRALRAAEAMAHVAVRFISDDAFRANVQNDFRPKV